MGYAFTSPTGVLAFRLLTSRQSRAAEQQSAMVASRRDLLLFFFDHPIYPKRKIIANIEKFISIQEILLVSSEIFLKTATRFHLSECTSKCPKNRRVTRTKNQI
jgi:hypothetical protein